MKSLLNKKLIPYKLTSLTTKQFNLVHPKKSAKNHDIKNNDITKYYCKEDHKFDWEK